MSTQQWVKSGDVIFREGEPGDHMYIVTKGAVKLAKNSMKGAISLAEVTAGGFFGEMILLGEPRRTATATASTETNLLVFDRDDLNDLIRKQPEVVERMIHSLVKRLKNTTDALTEAREKIPPEDNQRRF